MPVKKAAAKTSTKRSGRAVAKQPAKKTVAAKSVKGHAKKVSTKSPKTNPAAEEALLAEILGGGADGNEGFDGDTSTSLSTDSDNEPFCDEGPLSADHVETVPTTITSEETIIGDEPGATSSEILAGADSDEDEGGADAELDEIIDELNELEAEDDEEDEDDSDDDCDE